MENNNIITYSERKNMVIGIVGSIILVILFIVYLIWMIIKIKTPEINSSDILKGTFTKETVDDFNENYPLYSLNSFLKGGISNLLLIQENNDIIKGKNNVLLKKYYYTPGERIEKIKNSINSFKKSNSKLNVGVCIIPTKGEIYEENTLFYKEDSERVLIDKIYGGLDKSIYTIDVEEALTDHKEEDIYFKRDSLITMVGGNYIYKEMAKTLDLNMSDDSFTAVPVTSSFVGRLSINSGYYKNKKEIITLYFNNHSETKLYWTDSNGEEYSSLYCESGLNSSDKSNVVLNGGEGRIDVETTSLSGKRLLVYKSRDFNYILPFLIEHYEKIILVDIETGNDKANKIVKDENITDVLICSDSITLGKSQKIADLLK